MRQCLDSLVHQTLKDIEIIVVNDCSPDNSEAIILEYAEKDNRIVYIKHEENKCLGGARNTGIRMARGKYITFVDSDDYVDVRLYAAVVQVLEEHNVDIVSIPYQKFDEQGWQETSYKPCDHVYTVNLDELHGGTFYSAWSKVYRLIDLHKHELMFPEHVYWEDVPFWLEYCAVMYPKVWNLSDQYGFYWYRWSAQSIMGRAYVTFKDIPLAFIEVYHNLCRRDLMNKDMLFSFYKIVMNHFAEASRVLQKKYYEEFAENVNTLLDEIGDNLTERSTAPIWYDIIRKKSYPARLQAAKQLLWVLKIKLRLKVLYRFVRKLLYLSE